MIEKIIDWYCTSAIGAAINGILTVTIALVIFGGMIAFVLSGH